MTRGTAGRLVPLSFRGFAFVEVVRGTQLGHLPSWGPISMRRVPSVPARMPSPTPTVCVLIKTALIFLFNFSLNLYFLN